MGEVGQEINNILLSKVSEISGFISFTADRRKGR